MSANPSPALSRFEVCRDFTMAQEGHYSDDRQDAGNWWGHVLIGCYAGVTAPALLRCYGSKMGRPLTAAYMRTLPVPAVSAVYLSYWSAMGCEGLGRGIDLMVFDFGFNSGEQHAVLFLQLCLGFPIVGNPQTTLDGFCGPTTLRLAQAADPVRLIHDLHARQVAFYRGLAQFPRFGLGWLDRTVRRRDAALAAVVA